MADRQEHSQYDSNAIAFFTDCETNINWLTRGAKKLLGFNNFSDRIQDRNLFSNYIRPSLSGEKREWFIEITSNILAALKPQETQKLLPLLGRDSRELSEVVAAKSANWKYITEYAVYPINSLNGRWVSTIMRFREGLYIEISNEVKKPSRQKIVESVIPQQAPGNCPVAILISDIQDSSVVCATMNPRHYYDLITLIGLKINEVARNNGAVIGKHVGDGYTLFFLPNLSVDYRVRALNCAIDIRRAINQVTKKYMESIQKQYVEILVNIALHCGVEWCGYQPNGFTVLGDACNDAARISDSTRGGKIMCSKYLIQGIDSDVFSYGLSDTGYPGGFTRLCDIYEKNPTIGSAANLQHNRLPVTEIYGYMHQTEKEKI